MSRKPDTSFDRFLNAFNVMMFTALTVWQIMAHKADLATFDAAVAMGFLMLFIYRIAKW